MSVWALPGALGAENLIVIVSSTTYAVNAAYLANALANFTVVTCQCCCDKTMWMLALDSCHSPKISVDLN